MVRLSDVKCGACVRIVGLNATQDICLRLRELGICEHEDVRKVADNGSMVCEVKNTRIAINRAIAEDIVCQILP